MPPKKAAASSLVGEYDIELMNEEELRMYVEALKEEHQRMRKARNLYQKDKSELLGFLKSTQDNNTDRAKKNIQKDFEIQELMMTGEQTSKYEDESNKIMALENGNKTSRRTVEFYVTLKIVEFLNKEKEEPLIKHIAERNRDVKHLQYTLELMLTHLKENTCMKRFESNISLKNNSENLVHEYNENFLTILNEFSENKIVKLQAVWGGGDIPTSEYNPLVDTLTKMTMYFKDMFLRVFNNGQSRD